MKSLQLEAQCSHWTIALNEKSFFVALGVLTIVHWLASGLLPLTEDELYYWSWAKELQWSYFDHPPMVAYLIRLSTFVFGDNAFGIRFFACLISSLILLIISTFSATLSATLSQSRKLLVLLFFTPIIAWGSMLMTPDVPMLLFWVIYLWWLIRTYQALQVWSDNPVHRVYRKLPVSLSSWVFGGIILGLGFLSKYTMVMAIPCVLLLLVCNFRLTAWVLGLALHLVVAALVSLPVIIFNLQHGFEPLRFQWNHAFGSHEFSMLQPLVFIAAQWLILGLLPFLLLPWVFIKKSIWAKEATLQVCFYFFALPATIFLVQSVYKPLEANWALCAYLSFWPLAQYFFERSSFRYLGTLLMSVGFVVPFALSALVLVHVIHPIKWITPEKDRYRRMNEQFRIAGLMAQAVGDQQITSAVYFPTYQWTSYGRYHGIRAEQIFPEGRKSHFTLLPKNICAENEAHAWVDTRHMPTVLSCFSKTILLFESPLIVRGKELSRFALMKFTRP